MICSGYHAIDDAAFHTGQILMIQWMSAHYASATVNGG
jgi:hypothetical protein